MPGSLKTHESDLYSGNLTKLQFNTRSSLEDAYRLVVSVNDMFRDIQLCMFEGVCMHNLRWESILDYDVGTDYRDRKKRQRHQSRHIQKYNLVSPWESCTAATASAG